MPKDPNKDNIYPLFNEIPVPEESRRAHPSMMGEDFLKEASEPVLKALDPRLIFRSLIGEESPARYKYLEPSMVAISKVEYMAYLNRHNTNEGDSDQFDKFKLSNEEDLSTLEKISTLLESGTIEDVEEQLLESGARIIDSIVILYADVNGWDKVNTDLVIRILNWNLGHNINRKKLWQLYLELSKEYHDRKKQSYDYIASAESGVE